MGIPLHRQRLLLFLFAVLAMCAAPAVHAFPPLRPYEEESLVYLSSEIVEGEIIRVYKTDSLELLDFKVSRVLKGQVEIGQTIAIAGSEEYRKGPESPYNADPLSTGDRLVLFAKQEKPTEYNHIPKEGTTYKPMAGGVRLILDSQVFDFTGLGHYNYYICADTIPDPSKPSAETVEQFYEHVCKSMGSAQEVARLVEGDQNQLDKPLLLKLLSERLKRKRARAQSTRLGSQDHFTELICLRFANTHDHSLIKKALSYAEHDKYTGFASTERTILWEGFLGCPAGRDFLLEKINDRLEPVSNRLDYARQLDRAGGIYRSLTEVKVNGGKYIGKPDSGNSGYITRIAESAVRNSDNFPLCRAILDALQSLAYFAGLEYSGTSSEIISDYRGAFAVLKKLHDSNPSQELRFAIERATIKFPEAYERLKSPCGPFVSILRPDPQAKKTNGFELPLECEFAAALPTGSEGTRASVILVHQRTQKSFTCPIILNFGFKDDGKQAKCITLPEGIPWGRYRIFVQLSQGDEVISTGHYMETWLFRLPSLFQFWQ